MLVNGYCILVVLLLRCQAQSASISIIEHENGGYEQHGMLAETIIVYCPVEFFRDVSLSPKYSNTNNSFFYKAGETATIRCDAHDKGWGLNLKNYPERHIVYPESTRKCQPNGTWSGSRPFCVNTDENIRTSKIRVNPQSVTKCHSSSDSACLGEWTQIGVLHGRCPMLDLPQTSSTINDELVVNYSFIFKFDRKIHFSFLFFNHILSLHLRNVSVYVKREDVITTFSEECRGFQGTFYDKWSSIRRRNERECSVIQLGAFTDQLKINYSLLRHQDSLQADEPKYNQETDDSVEIRFFRILEVFATEAVFRHTDGESMRKSCPMPPKIPNAVSVQQLQFDAESIEYACLSGHVALDPILGHTVNNSFIINCVDGDWQPYPYPICLKPSSLTKSASVAVEESARQDNETNRRSEFEAAIPRTTFSVSLSEIGNKQPADPLISTTNTQDGNAIEPSFHSNFNLVEMCYLFTIGLLASSLLTLFIYLRKYRFRRIIYSPPPTSRHSSSLMRSTQNENCASMIGPSKVRNLNRERSLLHDNFDHINDERYHIYHYPVINYV